MLEIVDFDKVVQSVKDGEDPYPEALRRAIEAVASQDETILSAFQSFTS